MERLGGETAGHGGGALAGRWGDVEAGVRPQDDAEYVANCLRGEETTLKRYGHALAGELPGEIRALVAGQRSSIEETLEQLRRLARVQRAA